MSTTTTHPPEQMLLEQALPRLGLLDRLAVRLALRAIVRLEARERRTPTHDVARELERARERTLHHSGIPRGLF